MIEKLGLLFFWYRTAIYNLQGTDLKVQLIH